MNKFIQEFINRCLNLIEFGYRHLFHPKRHIYDGTLKVYCAKRRSKFYDFLFRQSSKYSKHSARLRRVNRKKSRPTYGLYLEAIDLAKGVIVTVLERMSGSPGNTDLSISSRLRQTSAFIQGMELCDTAGLISLLPFKAYQISF